MVSNSTILNSQSEFMNPGLILMGLNGDFMVGIDDIQWDPMRFHETSIGLLPLVVVEPAKQ